jgi:protein pelota
MIIENRSRIIAVHASSAFKGAIREVLEAPEVMSQIKDTKVGRLGRGLYFVP